MELNIPERIALLQILPAEGSMITLRVIRELQNKLSFTADELKAYKIENHPVSDGGAMITWDTNFTATTKDIELNEAEVGIISNQLRRLESMGRLHMSMFSIYERFVEGKK